MEKVLLFSRPLGFDFIPSDQEKSETRMLAFGLELPDLKFTDYQLATYLEYLVAAQKWDRLGNDVVFSTWTTKEGTSFDQFDAEIQKFIELANRERPITADIYDIEFDVSAGVINSFIVYAAWVQRIREEGHLVDVLSTPINQGGEGV